MAIIMCIRTYMEITLLVYSYHIHSQTKLTVISRQHFNIITERTSTININAGHLNTLFSQWGQLSDFIHCNISQQLNTVHIVRANSTV